MAVGRGHGAVTAMKWGKWNMEEKPAVKQRKAEWSGATPSLESLRQLQLTALLNDVMNELGQVKAAQKLGIDRKTLWRCRKKGRLTPRLSAALEQLLLERDLSAAMRQGKRVTKLERHVVELQGELHSTREDAEGRSDGLREEHARGMRHVERRLVALESGRAEAGSFSSIPTDEKPTKGSYVRPRAYPQLVTMEAEEGEENVYGDATPVIVEWREARDELREAARAGTTLDRTEARKRVLTLEIVLIRDHKLTLPPASYPWDQFDRRDHLWERERGLDRVRVERNRAMLRLWLRRVLTFGLWRN